MIKQNFSIEDIELLAEWLIQFKRKKFKRRKITYVENIARETVSGKYYLISIDIVDNSLILGFSKDSDYEPIGKPHIFQETKDRVTYQEIRSKDKGKMSFLWIDFNARNLIFADRLSNGFVIYNTNSKRDIDTKILKQRWIFREEFITE